MTYELRERQYLTVGNNHVLKRHLLNILCIGCHAECHRDQQDEKEKAFAHKENRIEERNISF